MCGIDENYIELSELRQSLNNAIDCWGLPEILRQIASIANEKSEHEKSLAYYKRAEAWNTRSKVILRAANRVEKIWKD